MLAEIQDFWGGVIALSLLAGGALLSWGASVVKRDRERQGDNESKWWLAQQRRKAERELLERKLQARAEEVRRQATERETKLQQQERHARAAAAEEHLVESDDRLRQMQLHRRYFGRVLIVDVTVIPTGRAAVEWSIPPSHPCAPTVACLRDGKVLDVQHAYEGTCVSHLRRGVEYTFRMIVLDGDKDLEGNLLGFVVRVPTRREWERRMRQVVCPILKSETVNERTARLKSKIRTILADEILWEKVRRDGHSVVDRSPGTEVEKRQRKAALDKRVLVEREREEERRRQINT